jgi:hypothetical protein
MQLIFNHSWRSILLCGGKKWKRWCCHFAYCLLSISSVLHISMLHADPCEDSATTCRSATAHQNWRQVIMIHDVDTWLKGTLSTGGQWSAVTSTDCECSHSDMTGHQRLHVCPAHNVATRLASCIWKRAYRLIMGMFSMCPRNVNIWQDT